MFAFNSHIAASPRTTRSTTACILLFDMEETSTLRVALCIVRSTEFSAVSVAVPVVVDGMVLGSVPEQMAEPGPRKANVTGAEAGDKVNVASVDNNLCAGCWEVLPDVCGCVATRLCADCAYVRLRGSVAEESHSGIQGEG